MRSFRVVFSILLIVPAITACSGGGSKDKPDAFVVHIDAPADTPPPPPGCDYGELRDDTNDDNQTTGTPEDTMLNFGGTTVLCGKFNNTHFTPPMTAGNLGTVDADAYTVTLPASARVYVTLSGAGLEALGGVNLQIYSGQGFSTFESAGTFVTNHAVLSVGLPMGTYEFYVSAGNATAPGTESSYKVKITTDALDTRCAFLATGGFVEAGDTGTNLGNNMITWNDDAVDPAPLATLTAAADTPEATAITAAAGMSYRLSGTSALNAVVGSYRDSDTFEFTTGPTTNEIAVRFKFPTTTADMDIGFATKAVAGDTEPNFLDTSRGLGAGPDEELITTAVKPNTPYWLWVANYKDYPPNMTATTAATYEATICSSAFTPP